MCRVGSRARIETESGRRGGAAGVRCDLFFSLKTWYLLSSAIRNSRDPTLLLGQPTRPKHTHTHTPPHPPPR